MLTLSIRYVTPQSRGCERNMDDKQNKLYTDFVGSNVKGGISANNFDSLKTDAFINPQNKEFFEDMLRVGWLSGRISSSGPMIGTQKIVTASSTGAGVTLFRPDIDQVWELVAVSQSRTGATGSTTTVIRIQGASNSVLVEELSDNSGEVPLTTSTSHPLKITYENYLTIGYSSSSNADSIEGFASVIRVR